METTKKKAESKGAQMVRDLKLPTNVDSMTLADLLPSDAKSIAEDEGLIAQATDPKCLEDDAARQVIEYASMRQTLRQYRRDINTKVRIESYKNMTYIDL